MRGFRIASWGAKRGGDGRLEAEGEKGAVGFVGGLADTPSVISVFMTTLQALIPSRKLPSESVCLRLTRSDLAHKFLFESSGRYELKFV